jgi:hypothetical protein
LRLAGLGRSALAKYGKQLLAIVAAYA